MDEDPRNRYRVGEGEVEQESIDPSNEGWLSWVPEWFVALGGGCLFASTLITIVATIAITYLMITGDFTGVFAPFEPLSNRLFLVEIQMLIATGFQIVGVYFSLKRTHWGTVLLSCIMGSLIFVTLPFTITAFVLLALGKYHFSLATPISRRSD